MQEASTLKLLYDSLDEVMARGDMAQMLSALGTMRTSLDSLVNVPEFVGISDKVAMLETRVKEMAVPKLANAIKDRNGTFFHASCAFSSGGTKSSRAPMLWGELSWKVVR